MLTNSTSLDHNEINIHLVPRAFRLSDEFHRRVGHSVNTAIAPRDPGDENVEHRYADCLNKSSVLESLQLFQLNTIFNYNVVLSPYVTNLTIYCDVNWQCCSN